MVRMVDDADDSEADGDYGDNTDDDDDPTSYDIDWRLWWSMMRTAMTINECQENDNNNW